MYDVMSLGDGNTSATYLLLICISRLGEDRGLDRIMGLVATLGGRCRKSSRLGNNPK